MRCRYGSVSRSASACTGRGAHHPPSVSAPDPWPSYDGDFIPATALRWPGVNAMSSRRLASAFSVSVLLHASALSLFGRDGLISPAREMPPLKVILAPAPSAPLPPTPTLTELPLTPAAKPAPTRPRLSGLVQSTQSTTGSPTPTPDETLLAATSVPSILSLPSGAQKPQACRPQAPLSPEVIKLIWEAYARGYGWANPPVPPTSAEEHRAPAQPGC